MDSCPALRYLWFMVWYLLLILLLLLILWILVVPVMVFVHTDHNRYLFALPGMFRAELVTAESPWIVRGWILFVPYRFNPFAARKKKSTEGKAREKRKKRFRMPSGGISLFRDALRTIRIRQLEVDIDTDDFLLNAWLFPLFSVVGGSGRELRINFQGYNALRLDARVRMGALLWAVVRNRIKTIF